MNLKLNTDNPDAYALVNIGLEGIREFQSSGGNSQTLVAVEHDLDAAVEADPNYLPAIYYRGITRDLCGKSDLAILDLERALQGLRDVQDTSYVAEARFNLGIAKYHKYHVPDLEAAEKEFTEVLKTDGLDNVLRLQTLASLAQTHAQLMIQRDPERKDLNAVRFRMKHVFEIERQINEKDNVLVDRSVAWRIENALGLALMFGSDYLESIEVPGNKSWDRITALQRSCEHFEKADRLSPNNWAIVCNLGSIWMRFAYWMNLEVKVGDQFPFDKSVGYLERILRSLRPDYGFALYELGRLHRTARRFGEALKWFDRAEAIPEKDRDVSQRTLEREMRLAEQRCAEFP
jgi:tetratricopeptide (TPR) repeat protein